MSKMAIKSAFCKGTGRDPFDLLSELAACQVCGGRGKVEVMEPAIPCALCKAKGVYPRTWVTCTVCLGKGMVTVEGSTAECLKCKGTGMETEGGLPCINAEAKPSWPLKRRKKRRGDERILQVSEVWNQCMQVLPQ